MKGGGILTRLNSTKELLQLLLQIIDVKDLNEVNDIQLTLILEILERYLNTMKEG